MEIIFNEDLDSLNDHPVSGAIAVTGDTTLNRRWAETTVLPLIRFGAKGDGSNGICSVFSDESTLVGRAVRELCRAGHRRIALFLRRSRDKDDTLAENVSEPFRRAMKKYLPGEKEILISYGGKDSSPVQRLDLLLEKKITALIVIPGDTALELCAGIRRRNLKIPDDISVVGFDGIELGDYMFPRITTMVQPRHEMALESVRIVSGLISGEEDISDAVFETELLTRDSVRKLN